MELKHFSLGLVGVALATLTGCFDEPTPAYQTVPAEARVYLQEKGLKTLEGVEALGLGSAAGETHRGTESIDYVNLDRNALTSVEGIERLTGIKWLRLNENRLVTLPDLSALVNLRRIYLRDNQLKSVPETLKDLPALTDIELSGNPITEIPVWLAEKKGLKNLSFNRTRLTKLPENLSAWTSLQSLQLGELSLPPAEMARIRAALPQVAIVF